MDPAGKTGMTCILSLLAACLTGSLLGFASPQRQQGDRSAPNVTLTNYPNARWKALTSYIDKPALGDVNADGSPEIIGVSVFGDVYCVNGTTGQILWTYEDEHSFDLAIYICPALVDVNCDSAIDVVSITPQGNVICLDGRTGRKLWNFKAPSPIVYSPTAFDLKRDGSPEITVADVAGNLYILSNAGRNILTIKGDAPFYGAPAMGLIDTRPVIIACDRAGTMHCFDPATGDSIWKFAPGKTPFSTSPIFFKDPKDIAPAWKVLAGTESGDVYLVDARTGGMVWTRKVAPQEIVGDFSLGDVDGDGALEFVCSTSGSRVIAARVADGRELWSRKFRIPVRQLSAADRRSRTLPDALTGEPVLADVDGNGRLDVIVEMRGLNSYVYGLEGRDGHVLWNYGNQNLYVNPALNSSSIISTQQDSMPVNAFSDDVPVYSQPTPVAADFRKEGKVELIVNDRDEVGLISVPLGSPATAGTWSKYAANSCNNIVNFSVPCVGPPIPPTIRLTVEPKTILEGESARLCWQSTIADSLIVDQGVGTVGSNDCLNVSPTANTRWRVIARGCGGEAADEVSLAVTPRMAAAPVEPPAADKVQPAPEPIPPAPTPVPDVRSSRQADTSMRQPMPWALEDVLFEYDWYRLTPEARRSLDESILKLKAHPQVRVRLEATCDERGSIVYNQFLAAARVESVRQYLLENGIDAGRLELQPFGKTTRWDERHDERGWSLNRRVHFAILP